LAFPFPKDSSKYIIVSSPHTGNIYDSIYFVVYDTLLHTLTPKRGFRHSLLPTKYSEPLTAVPHCNGRDYWIVCRPYAQFNQNKAYSILITPAGPSNIDTVMISSGILDQWSGQLKSNSKGTRLVQAAFSGGGTSAFLYNFDKATGLLSNQVAINAPGSSLGTGAIFSPNDSIVYSITITGSQRQIWKTNLQTMQTMTIATPSSLNTLQMELGPDNNIYLSQGDYNANATDRLINCNSWVNVTHISNVLTYLPGMNPFGGLCNFVDAAKGPELKPTIMKTALFCKTYDFSIDNCWGPYRAFWKFGDGATATGTLVSHTYANAGIYTVTLQLSVGNYSLSPVSQTIQILSPVATIAGPTVVCKGSTFLNAYNTLNIPGATYTWSATNGTITTPSNQPNISLASNGSGNVVLSLNMTLDGCSSAATKTILIDVSPTLTMNTIPDICPNTSKNLQASPAGGVFSGPFVNGTAFTPTASGVYTLSYSYANANGCSNTATIAVTVQKCVGVIEEANRNAGGVTVYPNPGSGIFLLRTSDASVKLIVSVYNTLGEIIQTQTFAGELEIDLRSAADGVYYLRVRSGEEINVLRVIKRE